MTVDRPGYRQQVHDSLGHFRVTALLGPRQCGKTTLARALATGPDAYFDLRIPWTWPAWKRRGRRLARSPGWWSSTRFSDGRNCFRCCASSRIAQGTPARFLILGSASLDLVKGVSESLAGRVGFVDLSGFDATEVGFDRLATLWLRGGFPESFLSESDEASLNWRQQFIRTFLTRDIPQLGITIPVGATAPLLAHGRALSRPELERLGDCPLARRQLQDGAALPRHPHRRVHDPVAAVLDREPRQARAQGAENLSARQRPVSRAAGYPLAAELQSHPKLGASWEGLALEHVLRVLRVEPGEAFQWGTHGGAELDLMLVRGGQRWGFEFKYADAPRTTKSMRAALADLKLERLFVIYPGEKDYVLDDRIHVLALRNVEDLPERLAVSG